MTIFAEVVSDGIEVTYTELPFLRYRSSIATLICDAASEPYRRGESSRWFSGGPLDQRQRIPNELKGRPC